MGRTTQQIGKCGELFVQYQLLKLGIESAEMTTDRGVDLVAYLPETQKTLTLQVKTTATHRTSEGTQWVEWFVPPDLDLRAQYVAVVDLIRDMAWFLKAVDAKKAAVKRGSYPKVLYWYLPGKESSRATPNHKETTFDPNKIETSLPRILGLSH